METNYLSHLSFLPISKKIDKRIFPITYNQLTLLCDETLPSTPEEFIENEFQSAPIYEWRRPRSITTYFYTSDDDDQENEL